MFLLSKVWHLWSGWVGELPFLDPAARAVSEGGTTLDRVRRQVKEDGRIRHDKSSLRTLSAWLPRVLFLIDDVEEPRV
jgi:hypothetical protein